MSVLEEVKRLKQIEKMKREEEAALKAKKEQMVKLRMNLLKPFFDEIDNTELFFPDVDNTGQRVCYQKLRAVEYSGNSYNVSGDYNNHIKCTVTSEAFIINAEHRDYRGLGEKDTCEYSSIDDVKKAVLKWLAMYAYTREELKERGY